MKNVTNKWKHSWKAWRTHHYGPFRVSNNNFKVITVLPIMEFVLFQCFKLSVWFTVFDANAKAPQGLLTSDAYDFGNYDGCLDVTLDTGEEESFFGKYCLSNLSIKKKQKSKWGTQSEKMLSFPTWDNLIVCSMFCNLYLFPPLSLPLSFLLLIFIRSDL